jgi:hypothetical protein
MGYRSGRLFVFKEFSAAKRNLEDHRQTVLDLDGLDLTGGHGAYRFDQFPLRRMQLELNELSVF